ncbi:MAG: histidine kinase, partial [Chlorobi bacterium]|nr:histidine kinase [Chlorobiota bacterium]
MGKQIITLIYFLLICYLSSFSQNQALKFDHINTKLGLSHNTVHCILQDSYGFIWIGTEDGLNRFDGYEFKIFIHDNSDTLSISDNFIYSLYEDSDSQLWIGTNIGGLDKYDKRKEIFIHHKSIKNDVFSISDNRINTIIEDREGSLWIGTDNGLNKKERNSTKFIGYYKNPNKSSINDNLIRTLFEDSRGIIWIGTNSGGLNKFDKKNNIFKHYVHKPDNPESISDNSVKTIAEGNNGILWVGTKRGLNMFNVDKEVFINYLHNPNNKNSLSNSDVNQILPIQKGMVWVGTTNGLSIFNQKTESFINYYHNASNQQSISNNVIFSMIKDESGLIWIGVAEGGINKYNSNSKAFSHYKNNPNNKNSIDYNVVRSFFEDEKGIIWIGTLHGLNSFNPKNQQIKHYNFAASLTTIYIDRQKTMWLGTWQAGLYRISFSVSKNDFEWQKKKLFLKEPGNPQSISSNTIQDIYEDSAGKLWIGTEIGLNLFDRKTNTFRTFKYNALDSNSISDNRIQTHCICEDNAHNLWVGTWNGLNKLEYNKNTYSFTRFLHNSIDSNSLSDNRVVSLYYDKSGILWIGTYGGGLNKMTANYNIKLKKKQYSFISFSVKDGLPNNTIYGILKDNKNNLWLSTNNGLSKFNIPTNKFRNYYESDGLQDNQFFWGASLKLAGGNMLFGGINGFNMFNPDSIYDKTYKPPIIITDIQIFNHSVIIGKKYEGKIILEKPVYEAKKIELTHKHRVISIQFASLDYANPKNNKYAYRMKGLESQWNYVNNRQYVTYTNLPAGDYLFEIKATNSDGIWNENVKTLQIIISPPFWQTTWFYLLIAAIIVLLILVYIKMREKILRRRNTELEKQVKLRTKEITDSIVYSKHIQRAILPSTKSIISIFPESFMFFEPKEIIGGDFYWINEEKESIVVAVADCTGHGVPGALMSML